MKCDGMRDLDCCSQIYFTKLHLSSLKLIEFTKIFCDVKVLVWTSLIPAKALLFRLK